MPRKFKDAELGTLTLRDEFFQDSGMAVNLQDAGEMALFTARQLEYVKANAIDTKYGDLKFRSVFPVSNAAGAGADTITQEVWDSKGMAKLIGSYAKDLPRADVGMREFSVKVRELGVSFGFTVMELVKAQRGNKNLRSKKMEAALRAAEELQNKIAFFGDSTSGLIGLFSHPSIPTAAAPNGAASSPLWSTKTTDEILADLFNVTDSINTNTLMVERPNKLYLSPARRKLIARLKIGTANDTSVLEYFVQKSEFINSVNDVIALNECSASVRNANGASNTEVMIAGDFSAMNLTYEEPDPLKFLPEQYSGLEVLVPGYASTGGLMVNFPVAFNIMTGI